MPINSISLVGFRSIRKLTLELEALNVVVGANGCGKSNLYKAIHLLHASAEGGWPQRWPRKAASRKRCGRAGRAGATRPAGLSA
jgi:predicted ATPase